MARKQNEIYQLKVTLKGIRPPIWRRFQVKSNITFWELHNTIQTVMGWYNAHLHQFFVDGLTITDQETLDWGMDDGVDVTKARLNRYVNYEKQRFIYEYDFGDSWEHVVLVEKIMPAESNVTYPRCLKGKRACPPEDVGGIWGYESFLEVLANPEHEEYDEYMDWLGGELDPEEFDLEEINRMLVR